ncbi:MAG: hypothetical protein ACQEQC_07780 [Elusimicrobiota bacterium]
MKDIIIGVSFLSGGVVLMYFLVKYVDKVSKKQQKKFIENMKKELRNSFKKEPELLDQNTEDPEVDRIFTALDSGLKSAFTTNRKGRRPKRVIVRGKDKKGRSQLAGVLQHMTHGGGSRRYSFVFAVKPEKSNKTNFNDIDGVKKIGDWVVAYKEESISGGYSSLADRYADLKERVKKFYS